MAKVYLTAQRLREVLHYDPETGVFTWLPPNFGGGRRAGDAAGHKRDDGYIFIRVEKTLHRAHRLAWLYMTGDWPPDLIDHINRNPSDNRWANLREATHSQNHQNCKTRKDSTWGTGITLHKCGLFRVRVKVRGREIQIGYFKTLDAARDARLNAERIHFTHSPACGPQDAYLD